MPNPLKSLLVASLLTAAAAPVAAQDPAAPAFDFDQVVLTSFWQRLYPAGGYTLLCGEQFDGVRHTTVGQAVVVDVIFPLSDMMKELGCRDRADCRTRHRDKFTRMESDLHNMYPEVQGLVAQRIGRAYGLVDGEESRVDNCDVEWRNGRFEPRELARGNVARAVLYMRATYGLDLNDATLDMMKSWHAADPPSKQELERNDAIAELQGRRNPFVDRPEVVRNLHNLKR